MNFTVKLRSSKWIITLLGFSLLLTACNLGTGSTGYTQKTLVQPPLRVDENIPLAEVTFEVVTPANPPAEAVALEILDEVTGLALNPVRYGMDSSGENRHTITIPIAVGSDVKYRYIKPGSPSIVEANALGAQVRYRMMHVDGPSTFLDNVSGWTDLPYTGPSGRITGQIINPENNTPYPSALVLAAGEQTLTASDGTFVLERVPPGVHNLVAHSLDGSFKTFQQGAMVGENATTPALIYAQPAKTVRVTFVVQIPASEIKGLPVRMIGSTLALGNSFADLEGGMSAIASRAPTLPMIADNIYSITLDLPAGMDLRYKYTLGDGFWNAEHYSDGAFRVRQLIVPESDLTVTDNVESWAAGTSAPITFTITAPANTPPEDFVSIQFNPYGWTAPIPMWPLGDNQWLYVLYSPLNMFDELKYRYCRNDLCGVADDIATHAMDIAGRSVTVGSEAHSVQSEIEGWVNWNPDGATTTIIAPQITPRGADFIAGVEITPEYSPIWDPRMTTSVGDIKQIGSNWVVISPGWSYSSIQPLILDSIAGRNQLWVDTVAAVQTINAAGLHAALFPRLESDSLTQGIWAAPHNNDGWWQEWFDRYRIFALHYADLASQTQAEMLILGGPDITPALTGGLAETGEPSGVPENADETWQEILTEVRERYSGKIGWAVPYPYPPTPLPEWISSLDVLYVLFSASLSSEGEPSQGEMQEAFAELLDNDILPVSEQNGLPVVIAVNYASVVGAAGGCVPYEEHCLPFDFLNQPSPLIDLVARDNGEQRDIYNAALNAILEREWVGGFVSRGYYFPAAIQDASPSVNGKPAEDVLWYWYPKLTGR